jgi:protein-tyrosine-phosphatase
MGSGSLFCTSTDNRSNIAKQVLLYYIKPKNRVAARSAATRLLGFGLY